MITIQYPGLNHYVRRIRNGKPFAFARYGEGELKWLIGRKVKSQYPSFLGKHYDYVRRELAETITGYHQHDGYIMAIQHLEHFHQIGLWHLVESWLNEHAQGIPWRNAGVFRAAAAAGNLFPLVQAIRQQPLPVLLVGPKRLAGIAKRLSAKHIVIHDRFAYQQRAKYKKQLLAFARPAFISFSASFCAKWLIHQLWPIIGGHSFLIDFGSLWDGMTGQVKRPYHRRMNKAIIQANWRGC